MYIHVFTSLLFLVLPMGSFLRYDLMEYLTRNLSHVWLRNQTENQFSFNPYCSICCMNISDDTVGKRCGKHTMCVYDDRAGSNCKGFISIRFTQDEIAVIVDIHNTLRNKVATGKERRGDPGPQPMASNMRIIEWDPELAIVASRWASQCVFAHDMCRDVSRYPVGQNIAKGNFALNNDLSFIVSWYETVEMFNKAGISRFQLRHHNRYPSPLQYAQLVWAETYQVGCARVAFQRADGPKISYTEHFVCNYGPSGNIPGQRVYKVGEPCTDCPQGTGCTIEYPGLCGSEAVYEVTYKKMTGQQHSHEESRGGRIDVGFWIELFYFSYIVAVFFVE